MFTTFHAVLLGIVEGLTEFLPISSTGHLILTAKLFAIPSTDFLKSFDVVIQLGAILAVVVLYWRRILQDRSLLIKMIIGFIPTGIIGVTVYKIVKQYLLSNGSVTAWALLIGGVALILFEWLHEKKVAVNGAGKTDITYRDAAVIGTIQTLAMVPGVSRSAATIIGGTALGYARKTVVEFSFLLAIPTMLAASAKDLFENAGSFSSDQFGLLSIGFVVAFLTALLAVKFFLRFIEKHNFVPFGVYRIIIALIFLVFVL